MTIDEAIMQARKKADKNSECWKNCASDKGCKTCEQEHEQLAEWLEELKTIKSDGFTDNLLDMGFTKGYNKAIEDAKSVILQTLDNEILIDTLYLRLEQLKEQSK